MKKTAKKTKRRRTIGDNPLDALLEPMKAATKASRRGLAPAGTTPRPPEKAPRTPKVRATFHLPAALLDGLRDAVVALSGPPLRLTLAHLAEEALRETLQELQKAHNRGKPFPRRGGELKGGRPIGT